MDINFKCIHCGQDLTVDASGAGVEIQCPSCNQPLLVPPADQKILNPIMASAGAREVKHFVVPQREAVVEVPIEKPKQTLETTAKQTDKTIHVKTFRRSDCVEVGKDHFDEVVSRFLEKIGEQNIKSITPITYTHQDLASRQWITDFGVLIVYLG
jgi:DNA-directed RNA polymerase subunit RPC12/RpoP